MVYQQQHQHNVEKTEVLEHSQVWLQKQISGIHQVEPEKTPQFKI